MAASGSKASASEAALMAKNAKRLPSGRITVIRKKGEYIRTVEAASADEAIKVAIKEFVFGS